MRGLLFAKRFAPALVPASFGTERRIMGLNALVVIRFYFRQVPAVCGWGLCDSIRDFGQWQNVPGHFGRGSFASHSSRFR